MSLYETDFYHWTQQQAQLLRVGNLTEIDRENIAEEIESMGKQERAELTNRFGVLLAHLLKWQYQPERQSRSWQITIREQRRQIDRLIRKNPSLQPYLNEALVEGYEDAIDLALRETGLDESTFPTTCPYAFADVLDGAFLPVAE